MLRKRRNSEKRIYTTGAINVFEDVINFQKHAGRLVRPFLQQLNIPLKSTKKHTIAFVSGKKEVTEPKEKFIRLSRSLITESEISPVCKTSAHTDFVKKFAPSQTVSTMTTAGFSLDVAVELWSSNLRYAEPQGTTRHNQGVPVSQ
ncbi:hypothetical protein TNCV_21681 [Trichonephila clavipes]|nr:hypothetical protein TNCV_21681 [Trichonephila clavipes]